MPSSRDGTTYGPRMVIELREGKAMVPRSKKVGSLSQAGSIVNGSQSTQG